MARLEHQVVFSTFRVGKTANGIISLHNFYWNEEQEHTLLPGARWDEIEGWFACLSPANNYGATDWAGPFESKEEANDHLDEMYGYSHEQTALLQKLDEDIERAMLRVAVAEITLCDDVKARVDAVCELLQAAMQALRS